MASQKCIMFKVAVRRYNSKEITTDSIYCFSNLCHTFSGLDLTHSWILSYCLGGKDKGQLMKKTIIDSLKISDGWLSG